jgi:hypothetical protein
MDTPTTLPRKAVIWWKYPTAHVQARAGPTVEKHTMQVIAADMRRRDMA